MGQGHHWGGYRLAGGGLAGSGLACPHGAATLAFFKMATMDSVSDDTISRKDKSALLLAIKRRMARSEFLFRQTRARLGSCERWQDVAAFCAHAEQRAALDLQPGQTAPCCIDEAAAVPMCDRAAQALLRQMLAAGISRFHPDPVAALEVGAMRRAAKELKGVSVDQGPCVDENNNSRRAIQH